MRGFSGIKGFEFLFELHHQFVGVTVSKLQFLTNSFQVLKVFAHAFSPLKN